MLDCANVAACGIFRIITTLELFQHHFSQMGHRETSCDPHLPHKPSSDQRSTNRGHTGAKGREWHTRISRQIAKWKWSCLLSKCFRFFFSGFTIGFRLDASTMSQRYAAWIREAVLSL